MININKYDIDAIDDFELGIQRSSLLTYHIAQNTKKIADGIIFVIPGFGEDANTQYLDKLLKHIVEEYNLIAVYVEYHAFFSRLQNGAKLNFSKSDSKLVSKLLKSLNIKLNNGKLAPLSIVNTIDENITLRKSSNTLASDFFTNIDITCYPTKNEYQNFGILQSLDILTVLYDLNNKGFSNIISSKPIIAMGNSHGGYLSNLLTKIAPNTFDVVIDNSGYAKPPLRFIIGKEADDGPEFFHNFKNLIVSCYTHSYWTKDITSPNYFTQSNYEIRDLLNFSNIKDVKTEYIFYHSIFDTRIAPFDDKKEYISFLNKNNIKTTLNIIESEKQVDGSFIKHTDHGLGISNKELLKRIIPNVLNKYQKSTPSDICLKSTIVHKTSEDTVYKLKFTKNKLEIEYLQ